MDTGEYGQLQAFRAVAEHAGFAAAARALRVSPSALSQTIRRLERRLDARLFNRTTRAVALTEVGERLLARLRPALAEMDAALAEIRDRDERPRGRVRLYCGNIAADTLLAPLIGRFLDTHPDVTLEVTVEDQVVDLVATGHDAGISLGEFVPRDMIAHPLGPALRMCAAATPRYLARHGVPTTPTDLLRHRCLNWRRPNADEPYRWEFHQGGHWHALAVDGPLSSSRRELLVAAALADAGLVFWSEDRLQPWLDQGLLCRVLADYCPPFPGWQLYYPRQRHMPSALRAWIDFLRRAYPVPTG